MIQTQNFGETTMGQVGGKVALITGAAVGIGAACAHLLAREGAAVVLTDIDETRGRATAAAITKAGGKALFLPQDVTDEARWPTVVSETEKTFGRLDIVVANAGIAIMAPILEMTLKDWQKQQAINLDGVFLTVKHTIPTMRRHGHGGSIIMLSSVAGLRGSAGLAGYSATKGGVRLFAKSVALECALASDNIRVNSVHPGVIDTDIWNKMPLGSTPGHNAPPDPHAIASAIAPMGRTGHVDDIARGVLFLASDASSYMTGSELVIDGGITAGGTRRPT